MAFGLNQYCSGQTNNKISISAMTESVAFPFTRYSPIHPGLEFGYLLKERQKTKMIKALNMQLGWYLHKKVQNAFYIRAESAWQFFLKDFITADLYAGLGYMHVFYPGEVYQLNSSSGEFEKINQTGRPHALGTLGFGFTYRNQSNIEPFVRQDLGIESPFANGIPIMFHSFLKIGINIKLNEN